jgi:uncharacterized protein YhjY with autotransporter beta-barrel domain
VLSLATNLGGVTDFYWASNGIVALTAGSQTLTVTGVMSNVASAGGTFEFLNETLNNSTNVLISFGSQSGFTTNSFSVEGISGYSFALTSSNVSAYIATSANLNVTGTINCSGTLTASSVTVDSGGVVTCTGGTINAPITVNSSGDFSLIDGTVNGAVTIATGGSFFMDPSVINGNVNNSGRFSVVGLNNIINGTLTLSSSSTLTMGTGSQLTVNGAANLGGTFVVADAMPFGTKFTFLTATGPIKGAFSSIVTPAGTRGRLVIEGDPTASILIAPQSYTQLAQGRNQQAVATALDSFIPATGGDRLVISTSLDSLSASQYNQAFQAIQPTMYQSMATIAFNNANAQNSELAQRLWGLRVADGSSGGGFSMNGLGENMPVYQEGEGKGVLDSKKDILRPGADNHWGMFVDANGIFANANSGNMLPGYQSQNGGITAGLTYKWNNNFASGLYAGYEGSYNKYGQAGSGLGVGSTLIDNAVRFGVFGTWGQKNGRGEAVGFYANALAGGAYNNYSAKRVIQYSGINRTANSTPGAGEFDSQIAGGYDLKKGNFTFGPMASLQYTYLGVNGFSETGAQSLNYNANGWNSSSMLSTLGVHAAYSWIPSTAHKDVIVVPQINLSWQHEFMQNPYAINGNLGGTSPTFSNWSSTPIRDFLYTGVGVTVEFAKNWNTSFFYNASAGNQNLTSQNIFWSAGLKF